MSDYSSTPPRPKSSPEAMHLLGKAMERMGGRAWAESKPGEGATFYLEIPK